MLGWLRTMQLDPIGDDASLRALLKLPAYKAHPNTGKSCGGMLYVVLVVCCACVVFIAVNVLYS